MGIIIFLVLILIYLIFLVITSSLLDTTIKFSIRKAVPFSKLILPSTLVLITWFGFGYLYYVTLNKMGVDLVTYAINKFLNMPTPSTNLTLILGVLGLYLLAAIVLQSIYVYLINFNLSKPFQYAIYNTKIFLVKQIQKNKKLNDIYEKFMKSNKEKNNLEEPVVKKVKIDLLTCIFSSILTFVIIISCVIILLFIANLLSNKILATIIK